jgi:hypothetical protein
MSDEGKNIWSEDDTTERLMNFATLHVPFTGKEMGCALALILPLAALLTVVRFA